MNIYVLYNFFSFVLTIYCTLKCSLAYFPTIYPMEVSLLHMGPKKAPLMIKRRMKFGHSEYT